MPDAGETMAMFAVVVAAVAILLSTVRFWHSGTCPVPWSSSQARHDDRPVLYWISLAIHWGVALFLVGLVLAAALTE
ncbi:MAG TPA: hypothetical protein VHD36_22935 [Pirellulales bacterium]|nr:hypothetical protein [Pirellulales bacterium]